MQARKAKEEKLLTPWNIYRSKPNLFPKPHKSPEELLFPARRMLGCNCSSAWCWFNAVSRNSQRKMTDRELQQGQGTPPRNRTVYRNCMAMLTRASRVAAAARVLPLKAIIRSRVLVPATLTSHSRVSAQRDKEENGGDEGRLGWM